jgi:hypothetical protein
VALLVNLTVAIGGAVLLPAIRAPRGGSDGFADHHADQDSPRPLPRCAPV